MKRIIQVLKCGLMAALLAASGASIAQTGAAEAPAAAADSTAPRDAVGKPGADDRLRRDCLTETGSRLARRKDECIGAPGESYSQEDLRRTGEIGPGDALRRLSPAVH